MAVLLSLYFFTPRFVLWSLLGTSETPPEVVRAGAALEQLQHPLAPMAGHTLRVMEWRLFFPVLGHALHLPGEVYLALPHLGCLLALLAMARVLRENGFSWLQVTAATVTLATCSWFFVSTGWLAYFDSWLILGLLVLVFFRSRWAALGAVAVVPWIDEHFVLMLPFALLLRSRYLSETGDEPRGDHGWRESLLLAAGLVPWAVIRVVAAFSGRDGVTGNYLQEMQVASGPDLLRGGWHGLRWAWVFAAFWLTNMWRSGARRFAGWAALFLATLAVNLLVAEDLSRSASAMLPVVILGMIWLKRSGFRAFGPVLLGVAGLNLLFPAEHVVGHQTIPILYAPAELNRNRDPLHDFSPEIYRRAATNFSRTDRPDDALHMLDIAIRLDPDVAEDHANLALALGTKKQWAEARAAIDRAIALAGDKPEFLFYRAAFKYQLGDPGAKVDAEKSLALAATDWPRRPEVEQLLRLLNQGARPRS